MFERNALFFSVLFFVLIYCALIKLKPELIFYKDGTLKDFGIGYKNKTIMPLWLVSIFLAIISSILALYFVYLY